MVSGQPMMPWLRSYWYLCFLEIIEKNHCFPGSDTGLETGTLTCFKHINVIISVLRMSERLKECAELV